MNFERGGDIKKNLNVGLKAFPKEGRKFFVRFKLRESLPDFYPLQKLERDGKSIIATCIGFPESSIGYSIVECKIPEIDGSFFAYFNNQEWIIE